MRNLKRPTINAPSVPQQIAQIRDYLNQTTDLLNFIINDLDKRQSESNGTARIGQNASIFSSAFLPNLPEGVTGGNYIVLGDESNRTFLFVAATRLWVGVPKGNVIEWVEK